MGQVDRDRSRLRNANKKGTDPQVREKADELHASGIPFQMSMAIALGRLDLNTALERLARQEQVNRLMERHDLSRALATQITLGHADLEAVLARRRLQVHREENRLRSCLDDATRDDKTLSLALHGKRELLCKVQTVLPYSVLVVPFHPKKGPQGDPEEIHKLQLKYGYTPEDWKRVRKGIKQDSKLARAPLAPIERPQDRYTCSDRRMFRYMDGAIAVQATLLEGEILRGEVTWFGRYEFGLALKGGRAEVPVFGHALHDLRDA